VLVAGKLRKRGMTSCLANKCWTWT